jgi:outer membrane protein OmpA-like peptidoglycan-associated protein
VRRAALALLALALFVACASAPRPPVLAEAASVSTTPAAKEAERLAPQAFAEAERIRREADKAHEQGDGAAAQILGEHAIAAHTRAVVLARRVKAEQRLAQAELELSKAQAELADLDAKQRFAATEADDLEKRVRMFEDALPLAPNAPASPEREKARLEAARSMASQARLLCLSTRLLAESAEGLAETLAKLDALDAQLAKPAGATPIDEAIRLRATCLRQLTLVRREPLRKAPADGRSDALLAELSRSGDLFPFRDDRGVVITLRGLFAPGAQTLNATGAERVALLGRVAKAHPDFPVLVVVHGQQLKPTPEDERRGRAVADALRQAGASKVAVHAAGGAQPVAAPERGGAAARNQRIEIVFVTPST